MKKHTTNRHIKTKLRKGIKSFGIILLALSLTAGAVIAPSFTAEAGYISEEDKAVIKAEEEAKKDGGSVDKETKEIIKAKVRAKKDGVKLSKNDINIFSDVFSIYTGNYEGYYTYTNISTKYWSSVISPMVQNYRIAKAKMLKKGYKQTLTLSKTEITMKKYSTATVKMKLSKKQLKKLKNNEITVNTDNKKIATSTVNKKTGKITIKAKKQYVPQDKTTKHGSKIRIATNPNYKSGADGLTGIQYIFGKPVTRSCNITVRAGNKFNVIRIIINVPESYFEVNKGQTPMEWDDAAKLLADDDPALDPRTYDGWAYTLYRFYYVSETINGPKTYKELQKLYPNIKYFPKKYFVY